jgi:hypothetical protein
MFRNEEQFGMGIAYLVITTLLAAAALALRILTYELHSAG